MILDEKGAIDRQRILYNKISGQEGVMVRNRNRYENNGVIRRSLWEPESPPSAWTQPAKGANDVTDLKYPV